MPRSHAKPVSSHRLPFQVRSNRLWHLWHHIRQHRRHQLFFLAVLMLLSSVSEAVTLGAVLPFLGLLTSPEQVYQYPVVMKLAHSHDLSSPEQLILPMTLAFAGLAFWAGGMRLLLLWFGTRLAFAIGADLSIDVYRRTLYQPYQVHVARNSSEIISASSKVDAVVAGVLQPLITLVISSVLVGTILVSLIFINPTIAVIAALSFGIAYGLVTTVARRQLKNNSQRISRELTQVVKALQEGLGGIRDILLTGMQPVYCEAYRRAILPLRQAQGSNAFIGHGPRYSMEALGMMLIAALAYGLSLQPGGVAAALPVLGVLALGAQRLLPVLQQIYNSWASITGSWSSLIDVLKLLDQPLPIEVYQPEPLPLPFKSEVCFEQVWFRYSPTESWVLKDLSFTIPQGARVGLVGSTGSGKSTTLDLLMGLLEPTKGEILIDGNRLVSSSCRSWQKSIAHVPQSIYLTDASIAENIAFGVSTQAIDFSRVERAARQAQIADFIESCAEGYHTFVGERGIRLSGGQRQRIAIARALYRNTQILVLDEATSALDNATEHAIMSTIKSLGREVTVLMIAHRLSTVQQCDLIFELNQGTLAAQGTYDELMKHSSSFRAMARQGN